MIISDGAAATLEGPNPADEPWYQPPPAAGLAPSPQDALNQLPATDWGATAAASQYNAPDTVHPYGSSDSGYNPTTGMAFGVVKDANSPTGMSYQGTPTNADGSPYTAPDWQGAAAVGGNQTAATYPQGGVSDNGAAFEGRPTWGQQDITPLTQQPTGTAAMPYPYNLIGTGGNNGPFGSFRNAWDSAPVQDTLAGIRMQSSGGGVDMNTPQLLSGGNATGTPTGVNAPSALSNIYKAETTSIIPQGALDTIGNTPYIGGLAEPVVSGLTSPSGLMFGTAGPGGALGNLAKNAVSAVGGQAASDVAGQFTDNPWIKGAAGLAGGIGTYGAIGNSEAVKNILKAPGPLKGLSIENVGGPADVAENDARRALLDAVQKEANLRRVGTVQREISAGRSQQAGGITSQLEAGQAAGLSGEQLASQARSGAATGALRKTITAAPDIAPESKTALYDSLAKQLQNNEITPFDYLRGSKALSKVLNGEGLQPAEIKALRTSFGDEVANAIADRPKTATQLAQQDAREAVQNDIRATKQAAATSAEAEATMQRANRLQAASQETIDRTALRVKWKAIASQNNADAIQQMLATPFMTAEERAIAQRAVTQQTESAMKAGSNAVQAIWDRARKANPDAEDLLRSANATIAKAPAEAQPALMDASKVWIAGNRQILDNIGQAKAEILDTIRNTLTGDVGDSYLTTLLHRKGNLQTVLESQGMEPVAAKSVAQALMERELKLRYGDNIPADITAQIAKTKSAAYGNEGSTILRGASAGSQVIKNTMFGPADVGVFGQQLLHSLTTGGVNLLAGAVNRTLAVLHLPAFDTAVEGTMLSRRITNQLDGVIHGTTSGIVGDVNREGTVLKYIPMLKKVDPALARVIGAMTDFQFKTILGNVRDLAHEGNLVLLKATGHDIQNAAVRAQSAEFANALTSAAPRALSSNRALAESASLLSPSMRRAQVAQLIQVSKLLTGTSTERVLAAATITSALSGTLLVGKLINDTVGLNPFEFDPSKAGFGDISVPGDKRLAIALDALGFNPRSTADGKGVTFNLFPQEQVTKALATSIRVLSEQNPEDLAKIWANLGISSSSPALQIGEKAVGVGYQPGAGYRYGDLNKNLGLGGKLFQAAPIPPLIQDLTTGYGKDSFYASRDDQANAQFGKPYSQLTPEQQNALKAVPGSAAANYQTTNPDAIASQQRRTQDAATLTATQQGVDSQYIDPKTNAPVDGNSGQAWRDGYHTTIAQQQAMFDKESRDFPYTGPTSGDPTRMALDERGQLIKANTVGHTVNWDAVDQWSAANPDKQALIDAYYADPNKPSTDMTPAVTAYKAASKQVGDAGFFAIKDTAWADVVKRAPSLSQYASEQDYVDAQVKAQTAYYVGRGANKEAAAVQAARDVAQTGTVGAYQANETALRHQLVIADPSAALTAIRWGYWQSPDKASLGYLATHGASQ